MGLKLNTASNGSVTLDAANTSSNFTLTVPAITDTAVTLTATQTLTNKTLTTPNIDSAQFATVSGTAPIYPCRAWVNFNGTGTVAIRASGNVSSITDNGTGDYTVNFTTAMPDANYSAVGMSMRTSNNSSNLSINGSSTYSDGFTTTSVRVQNREDTNALVDPLTASVSIFR